MYGTSRLIAASCAAIAAFSTAACAQWTVTDLGPGEATGVSAEYQVGNRIGVPVRWSGAADSFINLPLPPDGFYQHSGRAYGIAGNLIVGITIFRESDRVHGRATRWNASTGQVVGMENNSWPQSTTAAATDGVQVVGTHSGSNPPAVARIFFGGATLHPGSMFISEATGVHNGQQVGRVSTSGTVMNAALWSGSATSFVNLHPAGASASEALGVYAGTQVGFATFSGFDRAGLWTGDSASWVDLHPAVASSSRALAASGNFQVGYARVNGVERASLWNGSANTWEDLSLSLEGSWNHTRALAAHSDANVLRIVGYGFATGGEQRALMWSRPIPAPTGAALGMAGSLLMTQRRRRPSAVARAR